MEVFSFLKVQEKKAEELITEKELLTQHPQLSPSKLRPSRQLQTFDCIVGEACTGKSWNIQQQIDTLHKTNSITHRFTVHAAEQFSPSQWMSKYRNTTDKVTKPEDVVNLGIHFNVSAYAPYHIVSRFLHNFVVWGIFWDFDTGDMDSVLENSKWHLFVET